MKKLFALLLALVMVLSLTACGGGRTETAAPAEKPAENNAEAAAPVAEAPVVEEVIDFSNVEIEPLFADCVDFETFSKSDFRAVKVKECVAVPKSKKLLQFRLSFGKDGERTILSGIAQYYPDPAALVGKQIVAITNLKPRLMMGIESHGMILSAVDDEGNLRLASVGEGVADGALIG